MVPLLCTKLRSVRLMEISLKNKLILSKNITDTNILFLRMRVTFSRGLCNNGHVIKEAIFSLFPLFPIFAVDQTHTHTPTYTHQGIVLLQWSHHSEMVCWLS